MRNPLDRKHKKTDIVTVKELLSGDHVFRVPDYQRGYAWDNEFCILWQDIKRLYRTTNRKHYTGMLALEEIKDSALMEEEIIKGTTAFYIVDGQQRVTSLIILIKALLSYIEDELPAYDLSKYDDLLKINGVYKFGYSVKRQDLAEQYFSERIFANNTGLPHADKYLSNINAAKEFIDKELKRVSGKTAIDILETILNRIIFNIYFITDDFDVRVTFDTINNRGKRLSKLELLKNRLMYLTTFFPSNSNYGLALRRDINLTWQVIYKNLCFGENQMPDDDYLKAHWIVYGRLEKSTGDSYIIDLLDKEFAIDNGQFFNHITENEYDAAAKYIDKYIKSLSKYSLYWSFVNKPEQVDLSISEEEKKWIRRLSRIIDALYFKAALMVLVAESGIIWTDKEQLYSAMEQFVFVNRLLAQDRNDLSFFVTLVKPLIDTPVQYKGIVLQKIRKDISNHTLHVDAQRIVTAIEAFKINVLDKKEDCYYAWKNGLTYFLYEYNESLNIPNAAPIKWYETSGTSIEHVLPQTAENVYWKTAFGDYSEVERKRITNSLGNLLLLSSGSENSSLRNYSFPVKKEMSVDSRKFAYCDGSRSARAIAQNNYWTINEINDRTETLLNFMYDNWFKGILSKNEWIKCKALLNTGMPASMLAKDYKALTQKLDAIDTTAERKEADAVVKEKPTDYLDRQFLDYIDQDIIHIKVNRKRKSYKDYITLVIKSNNNAPSELQCSGKIDGVQYTLRYTYSTNELSIWSKDADDNRQDVLDDSKLPSKMQELVLSLGRYLRNTIGQRELPKLVAWK